MHVCECEYRYTNAITTWLLEPMGNPIPTKNCRETPEVTICRSWLDRGEAEGADNPGGAEGAEVELCEDTMHHPGR